MEIKKPNPYKESQIQPKNCGPRKEKNVHGVYEPLPQELYKIRWKYITNKSGSREYFFTGLEIDSTLTEYADMKTIYPGDIVVFNKKGHANDGIKAKVKKVIKAIIGLEAKKKGISGQNLPKYYDLKFLHPPVINLKRIKHFKNVEEKYLKKLFVKKTYKCIPAHYNNQKFKEELERFAALHFTKDTPFVPQQIIAKHAKTPSKDTLELDKHIDPKKEDLFKIKRINYISHTEPKWNKKHTNKNVEVLIRIDLIDVGGGALDNVLSNASTFLNCHNRRNQLGQDLTSAGRDIKNKINAWFEPADIDDEGGEGSDEEEKVGGGCGPSKKNVNPTITQEEINEWMDFFNKETNDNEKNIKMGWFPGKGGGKNDLTKKETNLLLSLFP